MMHSIPSHKVTYKFQGIGCEPTLTVRGISHEARKVKEGPMLTPKVPLLGATYLDLQFDDPQIRCRGVVATVNDSLS